MIGTTELIIILLIVLVIFGAGKLKNIGGDLGSAIKSFKEGISDKGAVSYTHLTLPTICSV